MRNSCLLLSTFILLSACEDAPGELAGGFGTADAPLKCAAPPLRQAELGRRSPVDLADINLLTLPPGHHQASRRSEAVVQSTDETAVIPIFCDGDEAPVGCETGFVVAQHDDTAQFLPGSVVTEARPHTAVVIADDGSVVLQDGHRFRIFDGGIVHDFELTARSPRMVQPMDGVVHMVSEFGLLVWADGQLQQLLPDTERLMQTLPTKFGMYAFTTDFTTDTLVWVDRGATDGPLGTRTLLEADSILALDARVNRNGVLLEDHQRWFCVAREGEAEFQLVDPLSGQMDRWTSPSGDCRSRLIHAPGEGLWVAQELNRGDRLFRPNGVEVATTTGFVTSMIRAASGWLLFTRATNDSHLYTLSPSGQAELVSQRSSGFSLHEVEQARAAVPRKFGNGSTARSRVVLDRDGASVLVREFEGDLLNSNLSPEGQLWVTQSFERVATLHVLENGQDDRSFQDLALGSAHWLPEGGLLGLDAEEESRRGLYLAQGNSLTRLTPGRGLEVLAADAEELLVRYIVDARGTTTIARFDGKRLQPILERAQSFGPWSDVDGVRWLSTAMPARAHRVEGLTLASVELSGGFRRFAHWLDGDGSERVWGFVREDEEGPPCVCNLDESECAAPPIVFDSSFELLSHSSMDGPMAIGFQGGATHLWLDAR